MATPQSEFARLVIGYQHFLLPKKQAAEAFIALSDLELIEYDYNTKGYKPSNRSNSSDGVVQLHSFNVADLAVLELNRSTE